MRKHILHCSAVFRFSFFVLIVMSSKVSLHAGPIWFDLAAGGDFGPVDSVGFLLSATQGNLTLELSGLKNLPSGASPGSPPGDPAKVLIKTQGAGVRGNDNGQINFDDELEVDEILYLNFSESILTSSLQILLSGHSKPHEGLNIYVDDTILLESAIEAVMVNEGNSNLQRIDFSAFTGLPLFTSTVSIRAIDGGSDLMVETRFLANSVGVGAEGHTHIPEPSSIPEPFSILLLLTGTGALGLLRRPKKRHSNNGTGDRRNGPS